MPSPPSAPSSAAVISLPASPASIAPSAEGVIDIPPPPDPPFDSETFEPIEPPWQAIREWIAYDDAEPGGDLLDQRPDSGKLVEIRREDGSILVLDSDGDHGERRT